MTKPELVRLLCDAGYQAIDEAGVVMVLVASEAERARAYKLIKESGYNASYGSRRRESHDT